MTAANTAAAAKFTRPHRPGAINAANGLDQTSCSLCRVCWCGRIIETTNSNALQNTNRPKVVIIDGTVQPRYQANDEYPAQNSTNESLWKSMAFVARLF